MKNRYGMIFCLVLVLSIGMVSAVTFRHNGTDTLILDDEGDLTITGNATAGYFFGNGSQLTDVQASSVADNVNLGGNVTIGNNLTITNDLDVGGDIIAAGTGYAAGGAPGAVGGTILRRLSRSPKIIGASSKALMKTGEAVEKPAGNKLIEALMRGGKEAVGVGLRPEQEKPPLESFYK